MSTKPDVGAIVPKAPAQSGWRSARGAVLIAVGIMLPLVLFAYACESIAGGPIKSAAAYRDYATATKLAGVRTVSRIRPRPHLAGAMPGATPQDTASEDESSSCKDDLGFDNEDVTRDQPVYSWDLSFTNRMAYLKALGDLRRQWKKAGLTVREIPAPGKSEPDRGIPGISMTQDGRVHSFRLDHFSGTPVVKVEGDCIRHKTDFSGPP